MPNTATVIGRLSTRPTDRSILQQVAEQLLVCSTVPRKMTWTFPHAISRLMVGVRVCAPGEE